MGRNSGRLRASRIPRANPSAPPLWEAVVPYEAALDELLCQLQSKQAKVDGLKEKLAAATARRNGRHHASSKLNGQPGGAPTAELFTSCAAARAFAGHLLHLMRAAGVDLAAATRSLSKIPVSSPQLAKHAPEAHVTSALLGGFEHESFYLDGSLSSLLDPAAFRRERYTQFRDMRGMEPAELLGVLPTCAFGRYAAAKFASLLPPRVEEAILSDGEHRRVVNGGAHPRTPFYGEFLRAAKAVWMLHLLAFELERAGERRGKRRLLAVRAGACSRIGRQRAVERRGKRRHCALRVGARSGQSGVDPASGGDPASSGASRCGLACGIGQAGGEQASGEELLRVS